jgi:AcrR family transcriptional regulator
MSHQRAGSTTGQGYADARHGKVRTVTGGAQRKTRRRGAALEEDIVAAAWEELAESGWTGFSLAAVAARAGTSNNSVYRRWPTNAALIRAATWRSAPPREFGVRDRAEQRVRDTGQDGPKPGPEQQGDPEELRRTVSAVSAGEDRKRGYL